MIDAKELKQACRGRWDMIYEALGIDVGNGKHKCCPACSPGDIKSDRFRVLKDDQDGRYYCNGCSPGDGLSLVQKTFKLSFQETLEKVAGVIGYDKKSKYIFKPRRDPAVALNKIWAESKKLNRKDPVTIYLRNRGINIIPRDIRWHPDCWEPDTKRKYPAMIGMIRDSNGRPVSLHRTYLDRGKKANIEKPKKIMPVKKSTSGGAIRLLSVDKVLGIAEGIETALSCAELFCVPMWACISTSGMQNFAPPDGLEKIIIYGDNDKNFAGHKAAYILAHKLVVQDHFAGEIQIVFKETCGDFNDVLVGN